MTDTPPPPFPVVWEILKAMLLVGGLLVAVGQWRGANDAVMTEVKFSNERIESKVDQLVTHVQDQEVRLRVLEAGQKP